MKKLAVVAFGGNALLRGNQIGTIDEQEQNAYDTCVKILDLVKNDYNIIITHGNGPQIGNYLIRVEASRDQVPPIPLGVAVADTEGGMGYMIEQSLQNMLHKAGMRRKVATLLTQVIVDRNDPAILNPTKFVGPVYSKAEARRLSSERGWQVRPDKGRG